jgi:hypothetical protein
MSLRDRLPRLRHLPLVWEVVRVYLVVRRERRDKDVRAVLERLRAAAAPAVPQDDSLDCALHLGRATSRTLRPLPGDTRCLTQALVLSALLARRSIPGSLVIGVDPGEEFGAHAWVEYQGRPLLPTHGGRFQRLVEL